jgi:hypothetical protein
MLRLHSWRLCKETSKYCPAQLTWQYMTWGTQFHLTTVVFLDRHFHSLQHPRRHPNK